jgi:hypothetical protein
LMLHDIEYGPQSNRAVFFEAKLEKGILHVPMKVRHAAAWGAQ